MNKKVLLLTKDALSKSYLPIYGNKYWQGKTPNIDELAEKGTVFNHFVTAAPSTVMAFRAMITGKFPHEQPYDRYVPREIPENKTDFLTEANQLGYSCHIIWDKKWDKMVLRYGNCYGKKTTIHSLPGLRQGVGCHYNRKEPIVQDDRKSEETIGNIIDRVASICESNQCVLLWIHLPHVINGRTGYGTDIDLFDEIVGKLRKFFDDDSIFISADHGNMGGYKGKFGYGFDVKTPVIEIPLITPRLDMYGGQCNVFLSNVDIKNLILYGTVTEREYIFSDCAYYAQPHRKLAIIHNGMLYEYSKTTKKEELYDLLQDPNELTNLIDDAVFDIDRRLTTPIREVYFHPSWERVNAERSLLRMKKNEIWRTAPLNIELWEWAFRKLKSIYRIFKK